MTSSFRPQGPQITLLFAIGVNSQRSESFFTPIVTSRHSLPDSFLFFLRQLSRAGLRFVEFARQPNPMWVLLVGRVLSVHSSVLCRSTLLSFCGAMLLGRRFSFLPFERTPPYHLIAPGSRWRGRCWRGGFNSGNVPHELLVFSGSPFAHGVLLSSMMEVFFFATSAGLVFGEAASQTGG